MTSDVTNCSILEPNWTHSWKCSNRTEHNTVRFEYWTKENEIRTEFVSSGAQFFIITENTFLTFNTKYYLYYLFYELII